MIVILKLANEVLLTLVAEFGVLCVSAYPAHKQMDLFFTESIFGYHPERIAGDVENCPIATFSQEIGCWKGRFYVGGAGPICKFEFREEFPERRAASRVISFVALDGFFTD
jgi:hypothetical protein